MNASCFMFRLFFMSMFLRVWTSHVRTSVLVLLAWASTYDRHSYSLPGRPLRLSSGIEMQIVYYTTCTIVEHSIFILSSSVLTLVYGNHALFYILIPYRPPVHYDISTRPIPFHPLRCRPDFRLNMYDLSAAPANDFVFCP